MTTLFDYLSWRGDLPLSADPFHEVDGVILARFTYMPFHRVLRWDSLTPTTVEAVCRTLLALPDIETAVRRRGDTDLLRALVESPRYKGMELTAYADRLDAESQTQFSAITVKLEEGHYCVAYRGTDNTLIGWKEDFNMSFLSAVPAQTRAVSYATEMASLCPALPLRIGGHSKGGNLAAWAAIYLPAELQKDRLLSAYNNDGPGFSHDMVDSEAYRRVADNYPTADAVFAGEMDRQRALEAAGDTNLDELCEPTAKMTAAMLSLLSEEPGERRVLERLGYLLGRYIYMADALDDWEKDKKHGDFNPFLQCEDEPEALKRHARASLLLTIGEMGAALDLLELRHFGPILENIIRLGLPQTVEELQLPPKQRRKREKLQIPTRCWE